mgnify:FL=1
MHGLGNDFVLIDCRYAPDRDFALLARRLCHRTEGIGADGLLLLLDSEIADFRMRIFNSDGSEAQMCGNGIRCIGKYVFDAAIAARRRTMTVETLGGMRSITVAGISPDGCRALTLAVDMGLPVLDPSRVPVRSVGDGSAPFTVSLDSGAGVELMALSMGNPHGVLFVDDVDAAPVGSLGPELERHPVWPEKANIEFTQLLADGNLAVRAWERGAGETRACGTGACAAAVAAVMSGRTSWPVTVRLRGGDLLIDMDAAGHIVMTGPAAEVFRGKI